MPCRRKSQPAAHGAHGSDMAVEGGVSCVGAALATGLPLAGALSKNFNNYVLRPLRAVTISRVKYVS
jgi:hypothetical protein